MSLQDPINTDDVSINDSWAVGVTDALERSRRLAWIVATAATLVTIILALAVALMMPLRTVVPYTLLVDKQTGHVEALAPLEREIIAPDAALTRSFLVQYVIGRESFDIDGLSEDYRKVTLWSAGEARERYIQLMSATNPASPIATLPGRATVRVEVRSVSSLSADRSLVRFSTVRQDPGAQPFPAQHWAAVINYRFSDSEMTAEDRYINPLGFQVTRYRRDAETLPSELNLGSASARPTAFEATQ